MSGQYVQMRIIIHTSICDLESYTMQNTLALKVHHHGLKCYYRFVLLGILFEHFNLKFLLGKSSNCENNRRSHNLFVHYLTKHLYL